MDPCTDSPLGSLPFGYHVLDFSERFANAGAEASVTYIGPSISRFGFLQQIFGAWQAAEDPDTGECCACLAYPPCPYPYMLNMTLQNEGELNETAFCHPELDCLWPDTFTIEKESATAEALRIQCEPDPGPEAVAECSKPLYWGRTNGDGSTCECYCQITVNYRHKFHASWPRIMRACGKQNIWWPPHVAEGTFIDVREESFLSARLIEHQVLEYNPANYEGIAVPEFDSNEDPASPFSTPCGRTETGVFVLRYRWCAEPPEEDLKVPEQQAPTVFINTGNLEVTWSNVPLYDKYTIDGLKGCVNDTVFLGYPPESVLFLSADPIVRGVWGCNEVYDIVFKFAIQTSPVNCPSFEDYPGCSTCDHENELAEVGIFNNQIGIWNRAWCKHRIALRAEDGASIRCCTNWVPVQVVTPQPCDREAEDCGCCSDRFEFEDKWGWGNQLYRRACLDELFTFNECLQCYEDCEETWPDCAFEEPA